MQQGQSHTTPDGTVHVRDPDERTVALCGVSPLPVVATTDAIPVQPCGLCVSQAMVRNITL